MDKQYIARAHTERERESKFADEERQLYIRLKKLGRYIAYIHGARLLGKKNELNRSNTAPSFIHYKSAHSRSSLSLSFSRSPLVCVEQQQQQRWQGDCDIVIDFSLYLFQYISQHTLLLYFLLILYLYLQRSGGYTHEKRIRVYIKTAKSKNNFPALLRHPYI